MSERRDLMWDQWMKHWVDYPSQDNEGYLPDRGSYKAGFLDGFKCADANPAEVVNAVRTMLEGEGVRLPPSEGDEQDAEAYAAPWNAPVKLVIKGTFLAGRQSLRPEITQLRQLNEADNVALKKALERIAELEKELDDWRYDEYPDVEKEIEQAVAAERERIAEMVDGYMGLDQIVERILSPPPGEAAEKKKGGVE